MPNRRPALWSSAADLPRNALASRSANPYPKCRSGQGQANRSHRIGTAHPLVRLSPRAPGWLRHNEAREAGTGAPLLRRLTGRHELGATGALCSPCRILGADHGIRTATLTLARCWKSSSQFLSGHSRHRQSEKLPVQSVTFAPVVERSTSTQGDGFGGTMIVGKCVTGPATLRPKLRKPEENAELRRANELLKTASVCFAQAELDRRPK